MVTSPNYYAIEHNNNTGIEYEISLFYGLLLLLQNSDRELLQHIRRRADYSRIEAILTDYDATSIITTELRNQGKDLVSVTLETQNDNVGPADLVLEVHSDRGSSSELLGLSVKYANSCNLNITGKDFLCRQQIERLKKLLKQQYAPAYIDDMCKTYGEATNWFRKRKQSHITERFIDLIRDEVIDNWRYIDKARVISKLYHANSPIPFWIVRYLPNKTVELNTAPFCINLEYIDDIQLAKHETSYIDFIVGADVIGRMQVKFNNGFLEKNRSKYEDFCIDGIAMQIGQPFTSWNFSLMK